MSADSILRRFGQTCMLTAAAIVAGTLLFAAWGPSSGELASHKLDEELIPALHAYHDRTGTWPKDFDSLELTPECRSLIQSEHALYWTDGERCEVGVPEDWLSMDDLIYDSSDRRWK